MRRMSKRQYKQALHPTQFIFSTGASPYSERWSVNNVFLVSRIFSGRNIYVMEAHIKYVSIVKVELLVKMTVCWFR